MIRFPKLAIATSVVNRILNVHADIAARTVSPTPVPPEGSPNVPNTETTGPALDQELYAPTAPSDAPQDVADEISLSGLL